jgi:hypothetical protein
VGRAAFENEHAQAERKYADSAIANAHGGGKKWFFLMAPPLAHCSSLIVLTEKNCERLMAEILDKLSRNGGDFLYLSF